MSTVRKWKQGSTAPAIADQLLDAAGDPIDLTGSSVRFLMGNVASASAVIAGSAQVTGATTGNVQYAWGTADLNTPGLYYAYWEITYSGGAIEKLPQGGAYSAEPDYLLVRITPGL